MCSKQKEDLNLRVFNIITGINKSKVLPNIYHENADVKNM